MNDHRESRIRAIFERALDLDSAEREAFLREACREDETLLHEVRRLLAEAERSQAISPTADTTTREVDRGSELAEGRRIGPYRLIRHLGEGGMGIVWEALREEPVRLRVALKLIKHGLEGSRILARFDAERQALALMTHPTIARVLDAGSDDAGRPYFVMEYIKGIPIHEYCDRHNLSTRQRLDLMIQVCDGVHHAHQKGILHRDLKPSNIMVEIQDGKPVPRIIDFGVSKAIDRPLTEQALFTEFGTVVGTPEYMSPEQAEMSGLDVDTRTDVYSLGVILYQLLVGELPFEPRELRRSGLDAMRRKIREETPPKPSTRLQSLGASSGEIAKHRSVDTSTLLRECRGDLDWITMKALEKDRTRRYASASEFAEDLRRHLRNEPVTAGPPSAGYKARKFVKRHRVGVAFASAVAFAVLAGLAGTTYGMVQAHRAESRAALEAETLRETQDFMVGMFEINDPSESRGRTITAKEILDRGADRIRDQLSKQPTVQARLMESMGTVYRSLGLYRDSLPLLSAAVEAMSRTYGPDSPEAARARTTYAGGLLKEGDPARAIPLLELSLAVQEKALGPNDFELARTSNNLGLAFRLQGDFAKALPFLERALRIREAVYGADDPEVAKQLGVIGPVRAELQDVAGARRDLERAVTIREKAHGPDHPDVAASLDSLAFFYRGIGDLDRALETSARALSIEEKTLGRDHPGLCNTLINLGIVERAKGDLAGSEAHLRRSWEIARAKLAPEQRDYKLSVKELAKTLEAAGKTVEAAELSSGS